MYVPDDDYNIALYLQFIFTKIFILLVATLSRLKELRKGNCRKIHYNVSLIFSLFPFCMAGRSSQFVYDHSRCSMVRHPAPSDEHPLRGSVLASLPRLLWALPLRGRSPKGAGQQ